MALIQWENSDPECATLETNPFLPCLPALGIDDCDLKIAELSKKWASEYKLRASCSNSAYQNSIDGCDITSKYYEEWLAIKKKCFEHIQKKYVEYMGYYIGEDVAIRKCPDCCKAYDERMTVHDFLKFESMCCHVPLVKWRKRSTKIRISRMNLVEILIFLRTQEAEMRDQIICEEMVNFLLDSVVMKEFSSGDSIKWMPIFDAGVKTIIKINHPKLYEVIMEKAMEEATEQAKMKLRAVKQAKQHEKEAAEAAKRTEVLLQQEQLREIERLREIVRQKELENKALIDALEAAKTVEMAAEISEDPC